MNKEEKARLLDKAAQICIMKHAGQRDKMECAYFLHPMRVALKCESDDEKIVALLHDVIEDTEVTPDDLIKEGFPQYIVDAILSVTKKEGEGYEEFIARAKRNPIGSIVKLHDLEDNLNVLRLDEVSPEHSARLTKYLAARRFLLKQTEITSDSTTEGTTDFKDESSECTYEVKRIAISRSLSHRDQRARINQRLKNLRSNGGTEYMQNKISVLMPDRTIIADHATYSSFIKVVKYIGYNKVAELGLKYGQNPIVAREPLNDRYRKADGNWYVLANWPTPVVAQYINKIADELDLFIECDVVPK